MNMYEVLGLQKTATVVEIRSAFLDRARRFHPDQVARSGHADLRPQAERVFARMTEAHSTLSDPQRRAQYDASLSTGGQSAISQAETVLQAERDYRTGENLLGRGDVAGAEKAFESAVNAAPDEIEYRMMLTWARWLNPATRKEAMLTELVRLLERTAQERPRLARPHLLLGQLWRSRNDPARAEQAFTNVLRIEPGNLDAARELRLLAMRQKKK